METIESKTKFANIPMKPDLFEKLNTMAPDNRAAFVRRLILKEWDRQFPEQKQEEEQE